MSPKAIHRSTIVSAALHANWGSLSVCLSLFTALPLGEKKKLPLSAAAAALPPRTENRGGLQGRRSPTCKWRECQPAGWPTFFPSPPSLLPLFLTERGWRTLLCTVFTYLPACCCCCCCRQRSCFLFSFFFLCCCFMHAALDLLFADQVMRSARSVICPLSDLRNAPKPRRL